MTQYETIAVIEGVILFALILVGNLRASAMEHKAG